MASIEIKADNLHSRATSVRKLLSVLKEGGQTVSCTVCRKKHAGCKVIAAHEGGIGVAEDFEKWYFGTYAQDVYAQYYEFWQPDAKDKQLKLLRAYLHLALNNKVTHRYEELIAIHCEPYEDEREPHSSYKRSPHVHVVKSESPLPKCHFPLNLRELDRILSSVNNLTEALESAVQILCHEVLDRYPKK